MKRNCAVTVSHEEAVTNRAAGQRGKERRRTFSEDDVTPCMKRCEKCVANYRWWCAHATKTTECEYGKYDECAWGIPSAKYKYCAFEFIKQNPDGATLQEVADALGITRQRVEQIEKAAVERF
jgi:hypothetical protein